MMDTATEPAPPASKRQKRGEKKGGGAAPQNASAAPNNGERVRKRPKCSRCGATNHNSKTCPLRVGVQIERMGTCSRQQMEREVRRAAQGISIYIDPTSGNMYSRMSTRDPQQGGRRELNEPDHPPMNSTQPPSTQPETQ
ncbi:unnamed protein product [Linum trigynum]|uniref:CCHC-type domain-containing protein n=1 Tax=Linum trigynum TaxID=586398 RepID=A0AAV2F3K9_9ROSI